LTEEEFEKTWGFPKAKVDMGRKKAQQKHVGKAVGRHAPSMLRGDMPDNGSPAFVAALFSATAAQAAFRWAKKVAARAEQALAKAIRIRDGAKEDWGDWDDEWARDMEVSKRKFLKRKKAKESGVDMATYDSDEDMKEIYEEMGVTGWCCVAHELAERANIFVIAVMAHFYSPTNQPTMSTTNYLNNQTSQPTNYLNNPTKESIVQCLPT
jgi:hypothetical protein